MQSILCHAAGGVCIYRVCEDQPCQTIEVSNLKRGPFLAASVLVTGSVLGDRKRHGPDQNLQVLLAFGVSMSCSTVASVHMVMIADDM